MEEPNNAEWAPPPPPEGPVAEPEKPEMSEIGTLGNIFIEPGRTFEDLRRKPRFIIAAILMALMIGGFVLIFNNQMGEQRMKRFISDQVDKSPQAQNLSPAQHDNAVNMQMTISRVVTYIVPIFALIGFVIGGLLYWLAGKAFGSSMSLWGAVAVYVYSSFPQTIVGLIANTIVLFLKSADDIDIATSQRGLIHASLGFFIDGKTMPVLATFLNTIDLFQIWGWVLAAIGLRVVGKISSSSAWAIVLIFVAISLGWRLLISGMTGNPM